MDRCILLLLLGVAVQKEISAFAPTAAKTSMTRQGNQPLRAEVSSKNSELTTPVGAKEFEDWCRAQDNLYCHPSISHALFPGNVRGLTWNGGAELPTAPVLKIPASIVLSSQYDENPNWDTDLACALWEQVQKGSNSAYSGYCNWLLSKNDGSGNTGEVPPSLAPNALRRWSEEQKQEYLGKEPAGKALLELADKQESVWRQKYQSRSSTHGNMTWEQFEWAMEAVQSRAFCGIGGSDTESTSLVASVGAPVLAGVAGVAYYLSNPLAFARGDDSTLLVLGAGILIALVPTILQLLKSSPATAVLLPLIDSANHLREADSTIELDPLTKTFNLKVGPKCWVSPQLYVSYGNKGDKELLLNFGFLSSMSEIDSASTDQQRKSLAETFLERNASSNA